MIGVFVIVGVVLFFLVFRKKKRGTRDNASLVPLAKADSYYDFICLTDKTGIVPLESGSREYEQVASILKALDGVRVVPAISAISAVNNDSLATAFDTHRKLLESRIKEDPAIFKKTNWTTMRDSEVRKWVLDHLAQLADQYRWNKPEDAVPIIPFLHGTDAVIAQKIVTNGFSALSTLDAGYYGSGIYVSSSARYTLPYYATKQRPALILCLTIPGNAFPVVEKTDDPDSLLGKPIKGGYQSHYVLANKDGSPCLTVKPVGEEYFDELVLSQEAQALPFAIVEFDAEKLLEEAALFSRAVPKNNFPDREKRS